MKISYLSAESHARLTAFRRDLHAHPELAFEEHRTAALVAAYLEQLGIEVHTGIGCTGVVGVIRSGQSDEAIGLRADMDALPIVERNQFEYCSAYSGRMHACGHDGHTAMLLGAAEVLSAQRDFNGTVYLIFQPAEEREGGAKAMIEDGLFERFPMRAIFGMHNWPGQTAGQFSVHSGPVMAGTDRFEIEIFGKGTHAAMPHLGIDPIIAGASLIQAVQSIVARNLDPVDAGVISITQFHAGETDNVIADRASLKGTVRALLPEVRKQLENQLCRVCEGIAVCFNVRAVCHYLHGYPPTVNTAPEAALCADVAQAVSGALPVITDAPPSMGAEDFAYFLEHKPGAYVWIGNGAEDNSCALHNSNYDFNDVIIPTGVAYWVELVRQALPAVSK